jgi:hypothetical protein
MVTSQSRRKKARAKLAAVPAVPRLVKISVREFHDIHYDIGTVQSQLACATIALCQARDQEDRDIGAKAWRVIDQCAVKLDRLYNEIDGWHVSHNHSSIG